MRSRPSLGASPFPANQNWRKLTPSRLLAVLVALGMLVLVLRVALSTSDDVDFLAYYAAGIAFLRHGAFAAYDLAYMGRLQAPWLHTSAVFYPYLYFPIYLPAIAALALLPLKAARVAWALFSLGCLVAAVRALRPVTGPGLTSVMPYLLLVAPLVQALLLGQMTPLLLLAAAVVASLQWQGRPGFTAGLVAGVLLVKPFFVLPLALFWAVRREWRALAGLGAAAAFVAAGSWLVSPEACRAYFANRDLIALLGFAGVQENGVNATLYGELLRLVAPGIAQILVVFAGAAILGAVAWTWRGPLTPYHHAAFWLALPLVSPYLGHYDLAFLIVPLAFLVPAWGKDRTAFLLCNLLFAASLLAEFGHRMWPIVIAEALLFVFSLYKTKPRRLAPVGETAWPGVTP